MERFTFWVCSLEGFAFERLLAYHLFPFLLPFWQNPNKCQSKMMLMFYSDLEWLVYLSHGVKWELGYNFSPRVCLNLILFRGHGRGGLGIAYEWNNYFKMNQQKSHQTKSVVSYLNWKPWRDQQGINIVTSRLKSRGSVAFDPGCILSWAAIGLSPLFLWCACQEFLPVIPRAWFQVLLCPVNLSCFLEHCVLSSNSYESSLPSHDLVSGSFWPHPQQIAVQFVCSWIDYSHPGWKPTAGEF